MSQRAITTGRQLGAAIHDARTRAGLTQANLAERAGVSRKWLIGLEQGARTGAELGKVFDVMRALNLSIQLLEDPEKSRTESEQGDISGPASGVATSKPARPRNGKTLSTSEALRALEGMRKVTAPSPSLLEAMRQATQISPSVLELIRQATTPSTSVLDAMRQATQISPATLEAIRQATSSTTALETVRKAVQTPPSAIEAVDRKQEESE